MPISKRIMIGLTSSLCPPLNLFPLLHPHLFPLLCPHSAPVVGAKDPLYQLVPGGPLLLWELAANDSQLHPSLRTTPQRTGAALPGKISSLPRGPQPVPDVRGHIEKLSCLKRESCSVWYVLQGLSCMDWATVRLLPCLSWVRLCLKGTQLDWAYLLVSPATWSLLEKPF